MSSLAPLSRIAGLGSQRLTRDGLIAFLGISLVALFGISTGCPFDQIAFGIQIALAGVLYQAGFSERTPRLTALEITTLAAMIIANIRLWYAGPEPLLGAARMTVWSNTLLGASALCLVLAGLVTHQALDRRS